MKTCLPTGTLWRSAATCVAAGIFLSAAGSLNASTDSFSGVIVDAKPGRHEGTVATRTEVTGIDYQSSPTRWIGSKLSHSTQPKGLTATALEGRLMDPTAFAKAVKPGMHGLIYEGLWRDLYTQPRHEDGAPGGLRPRRQDPDASGSIAPSRPRTGPRPRRFSRPSNMATTPSSSWKTTKPISTRCLTRAAAICRCSPLGRN